MTAAWTEVSSLAYSLLFAREKIAAETVVMHDGAHQELLELASRAEHAARVGDHATLLAATRRLLTALAMHLDDEDTHWASLDDAARASRARDEHRVVEEFVNLVRAATRSDGQCRCASLAREAVRRLRHQIEVVEQDEASCARS
jgi:hypothetical protein